MDLEKQVCSFRVANKLRELGVKQESIFWHWATDVEEDGLTWWAVSEKEPRRGKKVRELSSPQHYRGKISAFTVAELGEILRVATSSDFEGVVTSDSAENGFRVWMADPLQDEFPFTFDEESTFIEQSEADARAKMLIYLIENGLISK